MYDLSILIPSRNEMFLARTIQDLLENIEGKTEIIVVLDGAWADPGIEDHERVRVIKLAKSIGQRAATNMAARLSTAKYLMKVDAHCAFDKGFDVKMMAAMQDNYTMVPVMRNLHAFDWVCPDGHRRYQSPSGPCKDCGKPTERDVVWIPKTNPQSRAYCFDPEPHFQYFREYDKRPEGRGDLTETMSLQGSLFMLTRAKYWELAICDENFGSWGSQGIEVAVKTWLSGGKVMVNQKTWYAHMFRTQGGDFGFPYPQSGNQVASAKKFARDLFFENKWPLQKYPLSWLVERFWPVYKWTDADLAAVKQFDHVITGQPSKGIIYYTDNKLNVKIARKVQRQLQSMGLPIVSASLKPMPHFGHNVHLPLERGALTMFKQILAALEASTADIVFFCEHDVLYPKSHFDFTPARRDTFYYNTNVWKWNTEKGYGLWVDNCRQVSGLCGYRTELIQHYKERIAMVEADGGHYHRNMGFEPGHHNRVNWPTKFQSATWLSSVPLIDIRHDNNLTPNRWSKDLFRDQRNARGWKEADEIPGWTKPYL